MVKTFDKNAQRMKRHTRVRGKISRKTSPECVPQQREHLRTGH